MKTCRIFCLLLFCLLMSSCGLRTIDASSLGFLPGASAHENTLALQSALDGGGCRVMISRPGTYDLDGTIFLDDDTELVCSDGVILRKASPYCNMFVNRGAPQRTYNSNITLRGLNLCVNGNDNPPGEDSPLFGLRAQLAFLCTHGVSVYDFKCEDLGKMQYAVQFNQSDNYILDTFTIRGDKDALHISSSDHFVLRNGVVQSFDDCLAFNASDWNSSNCVDGDITDGLVEDIVDESLEPHSGLMCRMLVGAWVDWYEGISIRRVTGLCARTAFGQETYHSDSPWSRNFHPDVIGHYDRYPHIEDVLVEDCSLPGNHFMFWRCGSAHVSMTFKGLRDFRGRFLINGSDDPGMKSEINFVGCDFTSCWDDCDLDIRPDVIVNVSDCTVKDSLRVRNEGTLHAESQWWKGLR